MRPASGLEQLEVRGLLLSCQPVRRPSIARSPRSWRDDQVRPSLTLRHRAVHGRHGFERAHHGRADRDHSPVPAADGVDEPGGRGGDVVALGGRRLVALGRGEARVQRHGRDQHATRDQLRHKLRRERPAGARHLRASRLEGEDGLVGVERPRFGDVAVPDRPPVAAKVVVERSVALDACDGESVAAGETRESSSAWAPPGSSRRAPIGGNG